MIGLDRVKYVFLSFYGKGGVMDPKEWPRVVLVCTWIAFCLMFLVIWGIVALSDLGLGVSYAKEVPFALQLLHLVSHLAIGSSFSILMAKNRNNKMNQLIVIMFITVSFLILWQIESLAGVRFDSSFWKIFIHKIIVIFCGWRVAPIIWKLFFEDGWDGLSV